MDHTKRSLIRRLAGAVFGVALFGLSLGGVLLPQAAWAQKAPDELVRIVADDVLKVVRSDTKLREGDKNKMASLIEEKIVPHFDFDRITRLVVGKSWREATPEQKQALVEQFRTMLVRSYSAAYTTYSQIAIDVKPLKVAPNEDDVTVQSQIKLPGGAPPVNVDYAMFKNDSDWKVYDVKVDGISMVTTYRSTFQDEIRKGGIPGLIQTLSDVNAGKVAAPAVSTKK